MGLLTKAGYWAIRNLGLTDPRLYAYLGGGETDSGEPMSPAIAMQLDTVWACVRRIAETVSTLPLHLYQVDRDGNSVKALEHPLYVILHDQPNIDMTAVEFWEAMVGCYLLWGNAYGAMERAANDRVIAIHPMRPDMTTIRRETNGSLSYTETVNGVSTTYPEDDVFHIKGFSLDGLAGLSPVAQARQTLGTARAAERSSGAFYRNAMRPSGFLKAPDYLTDKQRVDAKLILEKFKGAQNSGGVPLLEGGWSFEQLSLPPAEAEMLATRTFHVEQICRWFDVPPILVGHSGQTTWGSGIEQIFLGWLQLGLRSHLKRIEQAIRRRVLTSAERLTMYAEFNVEGLLRADSAGRAQLYAAFVQNGLRSRNQVRAYDNEPPMEGGDELTVQSNLIPLKQLGSDAHLAGAQTTPQPMQTVVAPSVTGANIPG